MCFTILPLLSFHSYSAARVKFEPEAISNQPIFLFFIIYCLTMYYYTLWPESLSIFLDTCRSGTGNKTLRRRLDISYWACVKKKKKSIRCQSRVPSNHSTTKRKQTVGMFSNNSDKQTTSKESLPWKLKIVQTFKLPFHFLLKHL